MLNISKVKMISVYGSIDGDENKDELLQSKIDMICKIIENIKDPGGTPRYYILDVTRHGPDSSGYECFARIYYRKYHQEEEMI